jgi:hypothetical protein
MAIFHQLCAEWQVMRGHLSDIICIVNETEATKVLREARQLVKSEQYAAALEKYIWFHDHALDFDRALAGVRLSYAIFEWVDLGKVYPPAREALERVRDTKTESLAQGTYDVMLFHDVASINRAFGEVERTRDLFKVIADADRSVAEKCFRIALESLVDTKEFALARSFITDPQKQIEQFAMPFKFGHQSTPSISPEAQEAFVSIYVKNVSRILQVFLGVGEEDVANRLRQFALECVADAQLRDRIMERLYSSPPPTRIQ